jgi:hypothetical protein
MKKQAKLSQNKAKPEANLSFDFLTTSLRAECGVASFYSRINSNVFFIGEESGQRHREQGKPFFIFFIPATSFTEQMVN